MKQFLMASALTLVPLSAVQAFESKEFAAALNRSSNCPHFRDLFWNEVYKNLDSLSAMETSQFNSESFAALPGENDLPQSTAKLMKTLFKEVPQKLKLSTRAQLLEALTALELGDSSTPARKALKNKIESELLAIEERAGKLALRCENSSEEILSAKESVGAFSVLPSAIEATKKTFSTYFQNCGVLDVAPIKYADPDMRGITARGRHPDGVGQKRTVTSKSALNASNPYLKSILNFSEGCTNVKLNPPIYDYGGKPHATAEMDSPLDFFRNAGSGTTAMGTDCSGLVFTSLATAGMKLKKNTALKAITVNGVSASMLSDPVNNGLDCMGRVMFTKDGNIQPGDIIAKPGHTAIVYDVGPDPFGVKGITRASDCVSSKMSSTRFNFSILQSSPIKNGIGVNRISITDYLRLTSSWKSDLLFYAVKACKAKFGTASSTPSSDGLAFVRHNETEECRSNPIALTGETCVAQCPNI